MLQRGQELGDWLLGAFGTSSGLPLGRYKLGYNPGGKPAGRQVLAEAGSMLLEMTRLSQLTGDNRYFEAVRILLRAQGSDPCSLKAFLSFRFSERPTSLITGLTTSNIPRVSFPFTSQIQKAPSI